MTKKIIACKMERDRIKRRRNILINFIRNEFAVENKKWQRRLRIKNKEMKKKNKRDYIRIKRELYLSEREKKKKIAQSQLNGQICNQIWTFKMLFVVVFFSSSQRTYKRVTRMWWRAMCRAHLCVLFTHFSRDTIKKTGRMAFVWIYV